MYHFYFHVLLELVLEIVINEDPRNGQFNLIVTGLDSVKARRWINNMIFSLLEYDKERSTISALFDLISILN